MNIEQLDKIFAAWAKKAAKPGTPYATAKDIYDEFGPPSKWQPAEPHIDELAYIITDRSQDFPHAPMPPELIAYRLSLWCGMNVGTNHPFIRDLKKWEDIIEQAQFGDITPQEEKELYRLIWDIAKRPGLKDNLGDLEDAEQHADRERVEHSEGVYLINIPDHGGYFVSVTTINGDEVAIFVEVDTNEVRAYTLDGDKYKLENADGVAGFARQAPKRPVEFSEITSLIGNTLASLISGEDGISILDLPY